MKKLFTLLTMLIVGIGISWGQDGTVVATMSDLVTGAGFSNAKTVKENSIYSFSYNTYIGAIDNSAVKSAYEGSGYVTVAMWIWGNSASGCLFGYGDQGTGVKYYISGTTVKTTTKNVKDFDPQDLNLGSTRIAANQWNLIAFAIPAKGGTWGNTARYYATETDGQCFTISSGSSMNEPASGSKKCAIGSGNQGNAREPFTGRLANVTVIQSTNLLNNSRIAELIGSAPSSSVWYKPAFGGRTWTWNTSTNKYDASDGTTSTGTPARADNKGPVYRFNSVGTITATSSSSTDTSDSGGAWVIGTRDNPSNVNVGIGRWAGSIDVETYQIANITYSVDLKSTEPDGFATVWTDGTLNFPNRQSCSINDGNDQRWYIGENGIINSVFTSVNKGNRNWNFQIVVADDPLVGETDTRIVHVRKRKVMTWGANISSDINGVTVFHKADDGTLTEKNTTNDANFEVTYDNTGMYVTYTCKGYFNTNDPNYTYTYSGGAGTSESRVSINHNGGSVKLTGADKTYYLNQSFSQTQTTVNMDGTTVDYSGAMGIGTATYEINNTKITTPSFITSQGGAGRPAVVNLTGNSVITVTGNSNVDTNKSSIMIGHWDGSSNVTLSGTAQIVAADAQLLVGKTGNTQTITLNGSSNITAKGIKVATSNTSGTNTLNLNGGSLNLGDVGITSYSSSRSIAVNVNENTTITATAATLPLSQPITIASGKTLTIDGGESNATVQLTGSITKPNDGTIKLKNARIEGGEIRDCSSLPSYEYENCTLVINETTADFDEADETITIINIPDGFTSVRLRRVDRKYITLDVDNGTATFRDSEAKVSGTKCLYDFTFSKETLAERKIENTSVILNSGSRGSTHGLNYDGSFNSGNSYNEETGLLKAKSTPWRHMTGDNAWPDNYSVAVYANVPDIENGCLMAFGSSTNGSAKYLALLRGTSSNEIKLVKGDGTNNAFEVIATMSAENATVAKHLVIFTKNGSTFKVYCDGVNVATTTYDQTLGTGFQIGSVHGGIGKSGIIRIDEMSDDVKNAVEIQSIRIFNGVLTDDQMSALMKEFPYVSKGGSYSRTISAAANLGEDGAWTTGETTAHIPTPVVVDASTYYPGVTITASADATLTVNENATFGKTTFEGSGTLTIAANEGHSLNIGGAVIIYSDVVVKFGAMDMSTSPVTKGEHAKLTFDFSDYNFNKLYTTTKFQITGLIGQDDTHINAIGLPTDPTGTRTYNFAYDDNHYWLTVTVRAPQDVYAPAGTKSITDNMYVKLTAEAATNNGLLIQDDNLVFVEDATVQFNQTPDFCGIKVQEGANVTVDANGSPMKIVSGTVIAQNGTTIGAVTGSGALSVPTETSITVASVATGTTLEGAGNVTMTAFTRSMNPTLTNWEGTIAIENTNVGGAFVIDNLVNESNSLVRMSHIQGWVEQGSTTTANIVLDNEEWTYGFNVTGVNNNASYTFTGDISGTGDFMYRQSNQESRTATFNFSGDLSEWTGKFNLNENGTGTTTVKVTSTDNINAGFANTATKANTLKVTFDSDEAQSVNGEVSNSGSGSLNLKLMGNGAKTIAANINASRLKIVRSTDAAVTISGTPTISVGRLSVYEDDDENTQTSLDIIMSKEDITAKIGGNASCALIDVADGGAVNVNSFTINGAEKYPIGDYEYYINHDKSTNDIVLVKHYTRNVTSGRFGSICIENAALVSQMTGIEKVLKVTSVETDRVVMDEVEEMTAGVPYIFKSNADAINLTLKGENADEPVDDPEGYLVGNFVPTAVPESTNEQMNYVLQSNQFRKVTTSTITSGRNRCYLKVTVDPSRQSTLGIAVDEGGATGIDAINSLMNNNAEIYDLNGRKLNDLRKGINIVNGVKVIVK